MKKVLLFNSPIYKDKSNVEEEYLPPIGLGYIATYLEKSNIDVKLIDCVAEKLKKDEILNIIANEVPEYVGINIFTQNLSYVREIVESCNINVSFIIGGQVTKFIYSDIIKWTTTNPIDVIIGEGEFIVPAIVSDTIAEEPIQYEKNRRVFKVTLNSIYFPDDISNVTLNRDYIRNREIVNHYGEKEAAIITSRGCIYNCAFCGGARSLNSDIKLRERSKQSIINEISDIISATPNVKCIRVLDDLFLKNRSSILKAISIFDQFDCLTWRAMAHVLSFNNTNDLLEKLKCSGCKELFIGIESGSSKIRSLINKVGSIEQIIDTIRIILQVGIDVKGYFIYGFPNETTDDCILTLKLAQKLKSISNESIGVFRTSVFQFRPYHGTQLYNEIIRKCGKINDCTFNNKINCFNGRSQYNFQSGNYSECTLDQINEFINKTLELNSEA